MCLPDRRRDNGEIVAFDAGEDSRKWQSEEGTSTGS
jgi:hypothetical protein